MYLSTALCKNQAECDTLRFQILSIIGLVEAINESCSKNNFEWENMSGCHGNGDSIFGLLSVVKSFINHLNHYNSEPDI